MSKPSPLRRNWRHVLLHSSRVGQTSNSVLGNSSPGQGRSGISDGLPHNEPQSAHENDDEEKQLCAEDPAPTLDHDVGPTGRPARPPPECQNATDRGFSKSSDTLRNNLDQYPDFWNVYNKEADKEDWDLTNNFAGDLDTLLIFAGLFSATNTAFIVESYKDLKQDSNDLTNNLLRNMMRTMHQSSFSEADLLLDYAGPPARAIVVNFFFFASLCCSLFTAFGAMIGKQWLNYYYYETEDQNGSPSARGLERHKKYMGLTKWKLQAVVETLPTLLQFSLFFFFIGLIDFLWPLSTAVAILIILSAFLTHLFYIVTLLIGILYPHSPFQTRLTNVLRKRFIRKKPASSMDQSEKKDILRARCTEWLKERTTFSDATDIVARAVVLLTDRARKVIKLDYVDMLAYFLRPWVHNGRVYLGLSGKHLQSSLMVLHDLILRWDRRTEIVHAEDEGNTYFLLALSKELWSLLLKSGTMDRTSTSIVLTILEKLGTIKQEDSHATHVKYLVESLAKPSSRQDHISRLTLLHDAIRSQNHPVIPSIQHDSVTQKTFADMMWGVDKEPDLDHRRVAVRLSIHLQPRWGYHNMRNFGRYLSLWRCSNEQPDPSISFPPPVLTQLYLRTLIKLLTDDQKRWAKELDDHGHLTDIEAISQDESSPPDTLLLCWIAFILLAHPAGQTEDQSAPPSQYYSEARVDMVIRRLTRGELSWVSIQREVSDNIYEITTSLFGYLQTAQRYGRISEEKVTEAPNFIRDGVWDYLLNSGMDVDHQEEVLAVLEKLGPTKQGDSQAIHAQYLIDSLARYNSSRDQLLRLALLHDAVRLQNHLDVHPYITKKHMREVLVDTMWTYGDEPDLDHRRVTLRLSWFLDDINGMYRHIENRDFSRYLSRWRNSNEQPDPSTSLGLAVLTQLYLRTLIALLTYNQERWAKELDEHDHLAHIGTINQDESSPSDTQLLCWMAFILLAHVAGRNKDSSAPPSPYYSEAWIGMVISRLNSDGLPWASTPREVLRKPAHVTVMMQSLHGYLQTAYRYRRIPDNKSTEVINSFKYMKNRMDLATQWDYGDEELLFEEITQIRKQEEARERAASEPMVAILVDGQQEMAPELNSLVNGLESLRDKEEGQLHETPTEGSCDSSV
ncbi:hypothetical protein FRC02_010927 [Tulasnella sp. 418]|nr:hypothetical protein FRC02_010927 [Tulasnella sp. 418]